MRRVRAGRRIGWSLWVALLAAVVVLAGASSPAISQRAPCCWCSFVALPGARLLTVLAAPGGGAPLILAGFGDRRGAEGYARPGPHRGVDVAGRIGADVLAAAGGPASPWPGTAVPCAG